MFCQIEQNLLQTSCTQIFAHIRTRLICSIHKCTENTHLASVYPFMERKWNKPYVQDEKRCYDGINSITESLHSVLVEGLIGQIGVKQHGVWSLLHLTWNGQDLVYVLRLWNKSTFTTKIQYVWPEVSTYLVSLSYYLSQWNLVLTNCFAATPLQRLGDVRQEDDNRQQHVRLKDKMIISQHRRDLQH